VRSGRKKICDVLRANEQRAFIGTTCMNEVRARALNPINIKLSPNVTEAFASSS